MWGQVNPISNSGVAISTEALWTAGGDGERVRTGPTVNQHNVNTTMSLLISQTTKLPKW